MTPRRTMLKTGLAGAAGLLAARAPAIVRTQGARRFVTRHRGNVGGRPQAYQVVAGDTILSEDGGKPTAAIFTFSYLLDVADAAHRPVLFLFPGGPGGSSISWHQSMAPRMIVPDPVAPGAYRLEDNPRCILDAGDLVFVDPVSAGFSRAMPGEPERRYWGLYEDAEAMAQFIRLWLAEHGRQGSPVHIGGVSYGTVRVATISRYLHRQGVPLAGVILDSSVISYSSTRFQSGNDLPNIHYVPSYAAIHWHFSLRKEGVALADHLRRAEAFALERYASALAWGDRLSSARRAAVGEGMAALIGLPAADIAEAGLRVPYDAFRQSYGAPRGIVLDRNDGRAAGLSELQKIAQYRDSRPYLETARGKVVRQYLSEELGIRIDGPYVGLALIGGSNWNWDDGLQRQPYDNVDMAVSLADDMRANPKLRIMMAAGHYDLATPYFASEMVLSSRGLAQARVVKRFYPSGHGVHNEPEATAAFQENLRAFVTAGDNAMSRT